MQLSAQLSIDDLQPHPKNPRKELGDLTELTESIRSQGVLQNLTVNTTDDEVYTVLIGHRRLEAAKLAGLDTVPCTIVWDMPEREQIALMMSENMQRSDLTLIEEAHGFQMMLDLGDDIRTIAKTTGLSQSTVRQRVKLNELDQRKLEQVMKRQPQITDFIKIEEIEDINDRNEVLMSVGMNDFNWNLSKALERQKRKKLFPRLIELVSIFAEKRDERPDNTDYFKYAFKEDDVGVPEDANEIKYYFVQDDDDLVLEIYRESQVDSETIVLNEERDKRAKQLQNLVDVAKMARFNFFQDLNPEKISDNFFYELILKHLIDGYFPKAIFTNLINRIDGESEKELEHYISRLNQLITNKKTQLSFLLMESIYFYGNPASIWRLSLNEDIAQDHNQGYQKLTEFGFIIPDEVQQLIDGTHEAYEKGQ